MDEQAITARDTVTQLSSGTLGKPKKPEDGEGVGEALGGRLGTGMGGRWREHFYERDCGKIETAWCGGRNQEVRCTGGKELGFVPGQQEILKRLKAGNQQDWICTLTKTKSAAGEKHWPRGGSVDPEELVREPLPNNRQEREWLQRDCGCP